MTKVTLAAGAERHAILKGVEVGKLVGNGSLYKVRPLGESATALLVGEIEGRPAEPVAWVNVYGQKKARVFYTSLGHPEDFKEEGFRRMLVNGVGWAGGRGVEGGVH